jgi:uncharacterized protein YhaN
LDSEVRKLGGDVQKALAERRAAALKRIERAKEDVTGHTTQIAVLTAQVAGKDLLLSDAQRHRNDALAVFPAGLDDAMNAARAQHATAVAKKTAAAQMLKDIQGRSSERDSSLNAAREKAAAEVTTAARALAQKQKELQDHIGARGAATARLEGHRAALASTDRQVSKAAHESALAELNALSTPERVVTPSDLAAAEALVKSRRVHVDQLQRQLHEVEGALKTVGGSIAQERLADAVEAHDVAVRREKTLEADYYAWKLLLEHMKEADAAQASNLGQVLAPMVTASFSTLTNARYPAVRLNAQLGTDGVVAAGEVRSPDDLSVGTREQLSTLYRLSLAEYLQSTIVLDDQLVQSDLMRMDWFRSLLMEKGKNIQIVVFTCRPADYVPGLGGVPVTSDCHVDVQDGLRAIDLGRAVQRR